MLFAVPTMEGGESTAAKAEPMTTKTEVSIGYKFIKRIFDIGLL